MQFNISSYSLAQSLQHSWKIQNSKYIDSKKFMNIQHYIPSLFLSFPAIWIQNEAMVLTTTVTKSLHGTAKTLFNRLTDYSTGTECTPKEIHTPQYNHPIIYWCLSQEFAFR
ncbi:hypothetical protein ACOSQ3_002045 [Xanthoceras sorbifolium]